MPRTEVELPTRTVLPSTGGLAEMVFDNAREAPEVALFHRPVPDGEGWEDVSARRFAEEVNALASGLVAAGLQPGDRIGIYAATRYEWTLFDYAAWTAGAVTVPIYESASAEQTAWVLSDSGAVGCVVDADERVATVERLRGELPALRSIWRTDRDAIAALRAAGEAVAPAELERRRAAVVPGDLATLVYTSGTTGMPRGCRITHANLLAEVDTGIERLPDMIAEQPGGPQKSTLLFLPLAHVFGRMVAVACVRARARLAHCPDPRRLLDDLQAVRPSFILTVPRVLERVYNGARQKAADQGRGPIFELATRTAIAHSVARERGRVGPGLRLTHAIFDRLVYGKLRAAFGGDLDYLISGGAPLGKRLGHFFRGTGMQVLEGYGLTETTAAASINAPGETRVGSVGKPLPGTAVRIGGDGEVLVRGTKVFDGYWNDPAATAAAFDGDWLQTGDLGALDAEGFLSITGRKKEILVTAGGKNVSPAAIEDRVRAHPLVSQCVVVGDAKPFIAALVTVDEEALGSWKAGRGKPADATVGDLVEDEDLRASLQEAIDAGNAAVSRAESVRVFRVLPADLTIESGHLTPSLKVRRTQVMADYGDVVEAIYAAPRPAPAVSGR